MCPAHAFAHAFARGGKGGRASRHARPSADRDRTFPRSSGRGPRPSSEKLGEYASTILSCGASAMGGEGVSRGTFTKTTDEKRVPRGSRNPDRVDRDAASDSFLGETKSFLSGFL